MQCYAKFMQMLCKKWFCSSMYLGLCGGVPLHVNATRLPGDLPLGACMHLHAHSCNPNGVVYEYIPDGWNNDLELLVFRSIMYIKAGNLVTFAYKGSMWRPYATLPIPPVGLRRSDAYAPILAQRIWAASTGLRRCPGCLLTNVRSGTEAAYGFRCS